MGIDVGEARVGVAICDPGGLLATPVESVPRDHEGQSDLDRIVALAQEFEICEIVVGLPLNLSGAQGPAAVKARDYARLLGKRLASSGVPVRLLDERLSTVDAHRALRDSGRETRGHRAVVDQVAAVLILQSALDQERATGAPPGERLDSRKPRAPRRRT
ncbi:putative pre-16S rRNA nuclease [Austwickia sp. TVS 96-490-7B]|nr:putative pre-16S rRNA nuclease [Austwickia sp. TVS 96-490-7B]